MTTRLSDDQVRLAIVTKEIEEMGTELTELQQPRDYYDGEQSLVYGTEKFKVQFGTAFEGFKDNFCRVVVDAVNDKVLLKGLQIGRPGEVDKELSKTLWEQFLLNDFDEQQSDLFGGTFIEGRSTLILWPKSDGGVTMNWNPAQLVRVRYSDDNPDVPIWATKRWVTEDGSTFVTFYTPDWVYKYVEREGDSSQSTRRNSPLDAVPSISGGRTLEPRTVEGETWPLSNPFSPYLPVVEFPNVGWRSELTDVIPQQDALNYILRAQFVAAEFGAFGQRVMVTSQEEPEGGWVSSPGTIWHLKPTFNPDGTVTIPQFGTFDVNDPANYGEIVNMYLQHMAHTTKTPARYFFESDRGGRGDAASGESLKVDDKPLNDKVIRRQRKLGNRVYYVARLVSMVTEGAPGFVDLPLGEPIWQDPRAEHRMALLEEGLKMVELGIPRKFVYRQLGLTAEEIEEIEVMQAEEQEQDLEQQKEQLEMEADAMPKPVATSGSASGPGPSTTAKA